MNSVQSNTLLTEIIDGITFSFLDEISFHCKYNEIFKVNQYNFSTRTASPLILDCGANIGMSVLYFKKLYPRARIIAFEPLPETFKLLQLNVQQNNLCDVQLVNAAVAASEGKMEFCANDDAVYWSLRDTGLSNRYAGPGGRKTTTVPTVRLSSYITGAVDYLKLDSEGMEEIVLREIEERIDAITEIRMEFHSHIASKENDLERVMALLAHHQFKCAFEADGKILSLHQALRSIKSGEKRLFIVYLHRQGSHVWWQTRVIPQILGVQNRLMRKNRA